MNTFIGVEFCEDGGGVALIHSSWLTPRKKEVYWPPYKHKYKFDQALKKGEVPDEKLWKLHSISRCFFECDDINKAYQKLKQVEYTSDVHSDIESLDYGKRKRNPVRRYISSSEDECVESNQLKLPRPPRFSGTKNICEEVEERSSRILTPPSRTLTPSPEIQHTDIINNGCLRNTPSTANYSGSEQASATNTPVNTPHTSRLVQTGFEKKLLSLLVQISEQNKEILTLIKQKPISKAAGSDFGNIPIKFPINSNEELAQLESYLEIEINANNLVLFLSTLGGKDTASKTNRILKHIFTNKYATHYSFYGKRSQKQPFVDLKFKSVVVDAVKKSTPAASTKDVEDAIKVWLKHSPQRSKLEERSSINST